MAATAQFHRRLAEIGLRIGGQYGFALAGGYAIAAHGIIERPSEDVDLFADWHRRADFPAAVDEVISAYQAEGLSVRVDLRLETFARLYIADKAIPDSEYRVELVANWRFRSPIEMEIGPVLHPDDVMAGKMDALYNRAAARDFIDIDAALTGGRYTLGELCELAEQADAGFDRELFVAMTNRIDRLDDDDFAEYGMEVDKISALRERVRDWQAAIRTAS